MEDERGTFRPVMARKEREREGKESSGYLTGSMGHGGDFLRLATASQLSALSSSEAQRSAKAKKPRPGPASTRPTGEVGHPLSLVVPDALVLSSQVPIACLDCLHSDSTIIILPSLCMSDP